MSLQNKLKTIYNQRISQFFILKKNQTILTIVIRDFYYQGVIRGWSTSSLPMHMVILNKHGHVITHNQMKKNDFYSKFIGMSPYMTPSNV